jgi:hypothetical protein
MRTCIHFIHTYMHTLHTHIHAYHTYTHECMHIYIHTYIHIHTYKHKYFLPTQAIIVLCMQKYLPICISTRKQKEKIEDILSSYSFLAGIIYIYIYIYIYIHTHINAYIHINTLFWLASFSHKVFQRKFETWLKHQNVCTQAMLNTSNRHRRKSK